jgi:hypothetical protein
MSYIGNQPYQVAFVTDTFSGDASTTAFTMSVAPANTSSVLVAVTGVLQTPSTYSVSGTTLTFSAAPPTGTGNISVRYLGIPASGVTTTAYRTVTQFTATAGQTTFTPPSYTAGFINVYRNGVLLGTADYTASNGTTVVLASGATSGDLVTVESFLVSSVLNAIPATAASIQQSYLASGVAGTGPAFSAYPNSSQSTTTSVFTKIQLNAEIFDTASCFDSTTNYRFLPNVAGYYQINGNISFSGSASGYAQIAIYKNGTGYQQGSIAPNNTAVGAQCSVSSLVYLNGTTDYVELWGWQNSGGSLALLGTGSQTYNAFSGALVRSA